MSPPQQYKNNHRRAQDLLLNVWGGVVSEGLLDKEDAARAREDSMVRQFRLPIPGRMTFDADSDSGSDADSDSDSDAYLSNRMCEFVAQQGRAIDAQNELYAHHDLHCTDCECTCGLFTHQAT